MRTVLGTMTIGQQVFLEEALRMLRDFRDAGGAELDTAYVYNDGECERLLGECFATLGRETFKVATKANPRITGRLDYRAVRDQLTRSLDRMGLESVDILYLHFPDPATSVEEPLRACAELYAEGRFSELGLSNFPLDLVVRAHEICDEIGCPRPAVYEGVYNALSRKAEYELLPALEGLGMRFYAYNPLAGGMLSGKYRDFSESPAEGRFALRSSYRGRYWRESYFRAVRIVTEACDSLGIPVAEAAYRWLVHHSLLSDARCDGIIIGASRPSQLAQNMAALSAGPLPRLVVDAMSEAWSLTEEEAPEYYTFYRKPVEGDAK